MTFRAMQLLGVLCLVLLVMDARADCGRRLPSHQRRDAATIQRLESAWTLAYLNGDTGFEACLLTADFIEIMSNGSIHHLSDELELAAQNQGKRVTSPTMPPITVHMHGDVAVAYGISSEKVADGKQNRCYWADYYAWKGGAWHVYFAQQTCFAV
jgi:hypothetical protein